jgi:hypothetical protein
MNHETWTDGLSDYLDGELDGTERVALEEHLADCAECAAVLADLRRVVVAAGALPAPPPPRDLWPGIERAIGAAGTVPITAPRRAAGRSGWAARRFTFSVPQLAAAALAGLLLGGGALWTVASRPGAEDRRTATAPAAPAVSSPVSFAAALPAEYDAAVEELEQILRDHRDRLDPFTVAVLEDNLARIDRALEESRQALMNDPGNEYLNQYLAESMRRKLRLLRQATMIVRADA